MAQIHQVIAERHKGKKCKSLQLFASEYFKLYPTDELDCRQWNDVYGCLYAWWDCIQDYGSEQATVHVVNPSLEEDGWLCEHTVVIALVRDMPFLVDSMRIEINRRNIAIHTISSAVIPIARDEGGKLIDIAAQGSKVKNSKNKHYREEALLYFEVNLHTSHEQMMDLTSALVSVIDEVVVAVNDYQPILAKANQTIENLTLAKTPTDIMKADCEESRDFIQWLAGGFFTFLGYSEYDFVDEGGSKVLRESPAKRLGLFKQDERTKQPVAMDDFNPGMTHYHLSPQMISFSKSGVRSRVHRPSYSDYVIVKKYNDKGDVCGECRYIGLYTSKVYSLSPTKIPLIREKYEKVFLLSGMDKDSYEGKLLGAMLDSFPRDELFQSGCDELYQNTLGAAMINERHMVRLFMRKDSYGKFVTCIVYVPRDVFSTEIRRKIQKLVGDEINSTEYDFTTYFSESILARAYLVFKVDKCSDIDYDIKILQEQIVDITRTWNDHLLTSLSDSHGEEMGAQIYNEYQTAFGSAYKENFEARLAVSDIDIIREMKKDGDIAMSFYQPIGVDQNELRFKVFDVNSVLELSDVIPVLEHLGLRVVGEHPYKIHRGDGSVIWLHDFALVFGLPVTIDVQAAKKHFQEAFSAVWFKKTDSDAFNRLVLGARLNWREVAMLRSYANYMKQTMFNLARPYIANTLAKHLDITRNLVALFKFKFDPRVNRFSDKDNVRISRLNEKIHTALDSVENLDEDRIIRRYLDMINGTLRTNFFQKEANGDDKSYISLKLSPQDIPNIPEPRPLFEIFVYSPRVEGVHLRGGKVARGGLRWSDRYQDYRTEVLGLVKAQQVKNAVIVPSGAKGGFICKNLPSDGGRDAYMAEGIECYKTFIRGLLDVTDNLAEGGVVPPESVVRMDEDDPYLVVAADKGTATFSDISNGISNDYGFWLGDAFASGGSQGYDHKGMGITAKGAWVSVQRHFKEKGHNIQKQDFTVIGVGDMAGDVFGNGMLLSEHIQLVSAFNHLHIFIDPSPDAAKSFVERKRLFETPRTGWSDYDKKLISKGGGVFNRSAKSIKITKEMKACFDISADQLTPTELIHALLKSPVDLIWNGGIGTYVKSSQETHAEVGDKTNDSLRVNGNELRCRVFGEGGNLGLTQRGRIEYCLTGGSCNTDFIDNAAGVDCSDHEVNIKILLNEVIQNGDMTEKQRNNLLVKMTDNVSELVLSNNYRQTQAISLAEHQGLLRIGEHRRFINALEEDGLLNRELEFLPSDEEMVERQSLGKGLTRPELSVLISYAKVVLKESLSQSDVTDDPYLMKVVEHAFPQEIRKKFKKEIYSHRLRKEIVATQLANDMVNIMGITFCKRLMESTGCKPGHVAKAYVTSRDIFHLEGWWSDVELLDYTVSADLQMELMARIAQRVRRASRWFLRNRRSNLSPADEIAVFEKPLHKVIETFPTLLCGEQQEKWQIEFDALKAKGLSDEMANRAASPTIQSGLNMVEAAQQSGEDIARVAETYFILSDRLGLYWFGGQISSVRVENFWQAMARESYLDDLESQMRTLVVSILGLAKKGQDINEVITLWSKMHEVLVERWMRMIDELRGATGTDFAMFSVALRELLDLAQVSHHCTSLESCDLYDEDE